MQYYLAAVSFVFGLVVGSFLNVVIHRLPRREPLGYTRSRCPSCGAPIRWYDNVPVIGWIVLRGRCRDCRGRISLRYPAVEIMTGAAFLLAFVRFGVDWELGIAWAFVAALIAVAFIDYKHMIIPNKIVLPGALVGLMASIAVEPQNWWKYLSASAGAAAFLFALAMIWRGGMGPGDIKMAAFMGAVLGTSVIVALFTAFLMGAVAGLVIIAARRGSRKDRIPFGPHLALGGVIAVFVGQDILSSYVGLYA